MESSNGGPQSGIPLGKHFTGQADEHKSFVTSNRALQNLTIFVTPMKRVDFSEVTGVRALSFRNLSVGETAGPDSPGQCGGGKTPPQISC